MLGFFQKPLLPKPRHPRVISSPIRANFRSKRFKFSSMSWRSYSLYFSKPIAEASEGISTINKTRKANHNKLYSTCFFIHLVKRFLFAELLNKFIKSALRDTNFEYRTCKENIRRCPHQQRWKNLLEQNHLWNILLIYQGLE